MHMDDVAPWAHEHNYLSATHAQSERRTRQVIAITGVMMVIEIAAGSAFHSMALLADGWHMASHTSALGITAFAYAYARRHAGDPRYSFGTWKVGVLGGFTSAVVLAVIALFIAWESFGRLRAPLAIDFNEAIFVAVVGLGVNLWSAYLLGDGESVDGHGPGHGREHGHGRAPDPHALEPPSPHPPPHDHNLRAAYVHVLADALTSVLAILALLSGKYAGWVWMDPMMGLVGSTIIGRWSYGLLRDTSRVLLDGDVEPDLAEAVKRVLEADGDTRVADVHLWRVGPADVSAIVSVVTHHPYLPDHYKHLLARSFTFRHVSIEVNACVGGQCGARAS